MISRRRWEIGRFSGRTRRTGWGILSLLVPHFAIGRSSARWGILSLLVPHFAIGRSSATRRIYTTKRITPSSGISSGREPAKERNPNAGIGERAQDRLPPGRLRGGVRFPAAPDPRTRPSRDAAVRPGGVGKKICRLQRGGRANRVFGAPAMEPGAGAVVQRRGPSEARESSRTRRHAPCKLSWKPWAAMIGTT